MLPDRALISGSHDVSVTTGARVPAIIEAAGERAKRRFVEFFAANIRNANTMSNSFLR